MEEAIAAIEKPGVWGKVSGAWAPGFNDRGVGPIAPTEYA